MTNLGASIGTARAGAALISALTASFLSGVQNNPAAPKDLAAKAQVELAGGIPFMSDKDLKIQLGKAGALSRMMIRLRPRSSELQPRKGAARLASRQADQLRAASAGRVQHYRHS